MPGGARARGACRTQRERTTSHAPRSAPAAKQPAAGGADSAQQLPLPAARLADGGWVGDLTPWAFFAAWYAHAFWASAQLRARALGPAARAAGAALLHEPTLVRCAACALRGEPSLALAPPRLPRTGGGGGAAPAAEAEARGARSAYALVPAPCARLPSASAGATRAALCAAAETGACARECGAIAAALGAATGPHAAAQRALGAAAGALLDWLRRSTLALQQLSGLTLLGLGAHAHAVRLLTRRLASTLRAAAIAQPAAAAARRGARGAAQGCSAADGDVPTAALALCAPAALLDNLFVAATVAEAEADALGSALASFLFRAAAQPWADALRRAAFEPEEAGARSAGACAEAPAPGGAQPLPPATAAAGAEQQRQQSPPAPPLLLPAFASAALGPILAESAQARAMLDSARSRRTGLAPSAAPLAAAAAPFAAALAPPPSMALCASFGELQAHRTHLAAYARAQHAAHAAHTARIAALRAAAEAEARALAARASAQRAAARAAERAREAARQAAARDAQRALADALSAQTAEAIAARAAALARAREAGATSLSADVAAILPADLLERLTAQARAELQAAYAQRLAALEERMAQAQARGGGADGDGGDAAAGGEGGAAARAASPMRGEDAAAAADAAAADAAAAAAAAREAARRYEREEAWALRSRLLAEAAFAAIEAADGADDADGEEGEGGGEEGDDRASAAQAADAGGASAGAAARSSPPSDERPTGGRAANGERAAGGRAATARATRERLLADGLARASAAAAAAASSPAPRAAAAPAPAAEPMGAREEAAGQAGDGGTAAGAADCPPVGPLPEASAHGPTGGESGLLAAGRKTQQRVRTHLGGAGAEGRASRERAGEGGGADGEAPLTDARAAQPAQPAAVAATSRAHDSGGVEPWAVPAAAGTRARAARLMRGDLGGGIQEGGAEAGGGGGGGGSTGGGGMGGEPFAAEIALLNAAALRVAAQARGCDDDEGEGDVGGGAQSAAIGAAACGGQAAVVPARILVREVIVRPLALQARVLDQAAVCLLLDVSAAQHRAPPLVRVCCGRAFPSPASFVFLVSSSSSSPQPPPQATSVHAPAPARARPFGTRAVLAPPRSARQELGLEERLRELHRFGLGRDGDFVSALAEQLHAALLSGNGRLQADDSLLARWLDAALLRASANGASRPTARLRLRVDTAAGGGRGGRLTAEAAPDALRLSFDLEPAVRAIIDARALADYNRVLRLRVRIRLCMLALERLALTLREAAASAHRAAGARRPGGRRAHLPHELHLLHLFTHEARHFLNALAQHMGAEACEGPWIGLLAALRARHERSVASLRAAHRDYLDSVLAGCLLEGGALALHEVLHALLALVTQAEQRASAEVALGLSSAESCASMQVACATLRQHTRLVAAAAHELAGSDRDSPMHVLLLRLDFTGTWIALDDA